MSRSAARAPFVIGRHKWLKNTGSPPQETERRGAARSGRTAQLSGNARGLPQIVFKQVRNGGCHGANGLGAQMDYVLGKAAQIIDPSKEIDGRSHLPAECSRALAERWADRWERKVSSGHSAHLIASFPKGTKVDVAEQIVRATCFDLLDQGRGRFNYVAAVHDDRDHTHAHIIVDKRNAEGEFFYFARDHEFTYDAFKDRMVEHAGALGVELVNTSRLSRGLANDPPPHERQNTARRGLAGELVAHGSAPYQHKPGARANYYVTVKTAQGEKTIWGKELSGAMADSGARLGEQVRVTHEGKEAVEVTTRDGQSVTTHRNRWAVEVEGRDRDAPASKAPSRADSAARKEPTDAERESAEWKRAQVLHHAQEYRNFAAVLERDYLALSKSFLAAASLLEQGRELTPNVLEQVKGTIMPTDEQMQSESERLTQTIEQVRDDLRTVREGIDAMPPAERPQIEAAYFDALRDVQEIMRGQADRELIDPANGTVYDREAREVLQDMDRDELVKALDGTGIDPDEMAARLAVQSDNAALETHWVEADAAAIADARGYDMESEDGRTQAFQDVLTAYERLLDSGLNLGVERDDLPTGRDGGGAEMAVTESDQEAEARAGSNEVTIPVVTGSGQQLSLTAEECRQMAETDLGMKLVEPVESDLVEPSEQNIAALQDYYGKEQRDAQIDFDAAGDPDYLGAQAEKNFDTRELTTTIEERDALIAEAKELASRDTLTDEQQRRLVEVVDQVLGREAAKELNAGNTDVLRDFGTRDEQLDIAEKYLEAEQTHGADRTDALAAVAYDRELNDMDKQADRAQELAREDALARQRMRDEGLER